LLGNVAGLVTAAAGELSREREKGTR